MPSPLRRHGGLRVLPPGGQEAALFLKGRGGSLVKQLKARMAEAAANLEFEKAATLRDRITASTRPWSVRTWPGPASRTRMC